MIIKNRRGVKAPKERIGSLVIPDGLLGRDLCEAIKGKIGYDWSYLDFHNIKLHKADLRYTDLRYTDLRYADLYHADLRSADLCHAKVAYADFTDAKNVNFFRTKNTSCAKHARIIEIPEITWGGNPITVIMPEGHQPLLISVGCQTHTPEEWEEFTNDGLMDMDQDAPEWYADNMDSAIKKAHELHAEWRKSVDYK